jgi:hypothetical protein
MKIQSEQNSHTISVGDDRENNRDRTENEWTNKQDMQTSTITHKNSIGSCDKPLDYCSCLLGWRYGFENKHCDKICMLLPHAYFSKDVAVPCILFCVPNLATCLLKLSCSDSVQLCTPLQQPPFKATYCSTAETSTITWPYQAFKNISGTLILGDANGKEYAAYICINTV